MKHPNIELATVEKRTKGMPSYSTRPWAVTGAGVFRTKKLAKEYADWSNAYREGRAE